MFKETVSVILSNPECINGFAGFTKIYLINSNVKTNFMRLPESKI